MTSNEAIAMRVFFLVGVTGGWLEGHKALWLGCRSIGKTPLDVAGLPGMHAGYAEGIEGGGAIVEKQNVRSCVFAVAGIDSFVFAIVNPESIKDHRHPRIASGGTEFISGGTSRAIHGNAGERPFLRARGGTVDSVPTINMESMACFFRRRRPGFGALRIIPAGGIESINIRQS